MATPTLDYRLTFRMRMWNTLRSRSAARTNAEHVTGLQPFMSTIFLTRH